MTTQPNFGVSLSKNSLTSNENKGYGGWFTQHYYPEQMRDIISLPNGQLQRHRIGIGNTHSNLEVISPALYEQHKGFPIHFDNYATNIRPYEEQLRDYFNSGFYARRLAASGLLNQRDAILQHNNQMLEKVKYYIEPNMPAKARTTRHTPYQESFGTAISFNPNYSNEKIGYSVYHEGKHAVDIDSPINKHNSELIKEGKSQLNISYDNLSDKEKKYIDYILFEGPDGVTELAGQLQPALMYMYQHKLTPQQLIESDYLYKDKNFYNILAYFKEGYVKKLLESAGILTLLPLIKNDNK